MRTIQDLCRAGGTKAIIASSWGLHVQEKWGKISYMERPEKIKGFIICIYDLGDLITVDHVNGHSRNLNWRYPSYLRPKKGLCKGISFPYMAFYALYRTVPSLWDPEDPPSIMGCLTNEMGPRCVWKKIHTVAEK